MPLRKAPKDLDMYLSRMFKNTEFQLIPLGVRSLEAFINSTKYILASLGL